MINFDSQPQVVLDEMVYYFKDFKDSHRACPDGVYTIPITGEYTYQRSGGGRYYSAYFIAGDTLWDLSMIVKIRSGK